MGAPSPVGSAVSTRAPASRVAQDLACRVMPGNSRHAAAWMGPRSAEIQASHRHSIVRVTQHRPRGEELVEREAAMKNIASCEPEITLEIEGRQRAARAHAGAEVRRVS